MISGCNSASPSKEELNITDNSSTVNSDDIVLPELNPPIASSEDVQVFQSSSPVFKCEPIPEDIIDIITGKSFKEETTISYSELSYLTLTYYDFDLVSQIGEMIVSAKVGDEVMEIFKELYDNKYPIDKIRLIDYYDADDDLSMADNNTSAFNFRFITNSSATVSSHGYGLAIDINPVQNPYISADGSFFPKAGDVYADRSNNRIGMIIEGDAAYNAFISRGWKWGGHWSSPTDYQHFEKTDIE